MTRAGWTEPKVLHIPYMNKRDRRTTAAPHARRVVAYRERFKAILGPDHFQDVCAHMHKTEAAAEQCRAAHKRE